MSADILADLKSWLEQLVADKPHRHGQLPEIEIDYVRRAIEEIERLRAAASAYPLASRTPRGQAARRSNAVNTTPNP
jgi:hypothetical protein